MRYTVWVQAGIPATVVPGASTHYFQDNRLLIVGDNATPLAVFNIWTYFTIEHGVG